MALLQDEPTISHRTLLLVGIPSFIVAVAISLLSHQHAHRLGDQTFCGDRPAAVITAVSLLNIETPPGECGLSALAGQAWTKVPLANGHCSWSPRSAPCCRGQGCWRG